MSDAGVHRHLLDRRVPIIGVAKSRFEGADAMSIARGKSRSPLFVSSVGIDVHTAARHVQRMHGAFRIPTLLKLVDRLSRRGLK